MTDFSMLGLAEPILRAIRDEGYTNPTPIQAQVIPAMMEGRDIVGIAQTGTGKTAAFVLPILHQILSDQNRVSRKRCRALVLTPTRELASQIAANVRAYGKHMRLSSLTVVGGVKPRPQIKSLERGVDIVIATPGRLLDHISSGAVKMDETTTVVLDEGDQMLDMGFIPTIRKIMQTLPRERQTLLMSATMPKQVRQLASDFLHRPKDISIGQASRPISRIEQSFVPVARAEKRAHLTKLLAANDVDRAIVFTRTKHGADRVVRHLEKAGLSAAAIHGNKNQNQRQRALKEFKLGGVSILVATDIAARGIDIDDVSHVVNFELPNVPESYVHRIGRTARAGKSGVAISLYDPSERDLLRNIERLISREVVAAAMEGEESEFTAPQRERSDRNEAPAANGKKRRRSEQRKKNRRRKAKMAKRHGASDKATSTVHSRSQSTQQMRRAS